MEKRALINIIAAVSTAIIAAIVLLEMRVVENPLRGTGLFGVFLASMLSHLTVIGRNMFVPVFLPLTVVYHPLILGPSAGLGGAIGEVTAYYWGLGIREVVKGDGKDNPLSRWIKKYGLIVILLVSASPLPDTPIVLLAGSARFPLRKLLIVEVIGKTLWYSSGAAVGGVLFTYLSAYLEETILTIVLVVASVAICVIVSWSKTREKVLQLFRRFLH